MEIAQKVTSRRSDISQVFEIDDIFSFRVDIANYGQRLDIKMARRAGCAEAATNQHLQRMPCK